MDEIIKVVETSSENEVNNLLALGQTQLGECPNCQDRSLEYIKDKYGIIEVVCNNHEQHYVKRLSEHRRYVDRLNRLG